MTFATPKVRPSAAMLYLVAEGRNVPLKPFAESLTMKTLHAAIVEATLRHMSPDVSMQIVTRTGVVVATKEAKLNAKWVVIDAGAVDRIQEQENAARSMWVEGVPSSYSDA